MSDSANDTGAPESKRGPRRELIEANHQFPCTYLIKAFGPGTESFRQDIHTCVHQTIGMQRVTLRERSTTSGRSVCVTLELQAETVDEVMEVYGRLYALSSMKLIL